MTSKAEDLRDLEALNRGYLLAAEKSDVAWYGEHVAEDGGWVWVGANVTRL